jgi:hypothetical protein
LLPGRLITTGAHLLSSAFWKSSAGHCCWRSTKLAVNQAGGQQNFTFDSAPQNSTNTAALLADEESDEAEAESPDRLLPSLIRCS